MYGHFEIPVFVPCGVTMTSHAIPERLLVQIASYNTNLQAHRGLPQDLVDWLAPTLHVSSFLSKRQAPDIVAVGFQELLPLHHGLVGCSGRVIDDRHKHILSQIEAHAPNNESYTLIAKVVHVGVALLIYGRDDGVARFVADVETSSTGCGPGYMGNKGAVGVRFRVKRQAIGAGETYTFVNCHLTAHEHKLNARIADYQHIVSNLLFSPFFSGSKLKSTLYETSHLFLLGDFNFRLNIPPSHPLLAAGNFAQAIEAETTREELKEFDQLTIERKKGTVFVGLREGEFWKFKCSYKYLLGEVDKYDTRRTPSWTDRILYTTYADSLDDPEKSKITNLLYTTVPSYTTSDHKPIVTLLQLPPPLDLASLETPLIDLPKKYQPMPDPWREWKRAVGFTLDHLIGFVWWLLILLGLGSMFVGIFNLLISIGAWTWWMKQRLNFDGSVER
jgi:hypothetical protein